MAKVLVVYHSGTGNTKAMAQAVAEGVKEVAGVEAVLKEAGKDRLTRDTVRDATKSEVQDIKRENARLKQLVAELSLQVHVLKKTAIPGLE